MVRDAPSKLTPLMLVGLMLLAPLAAANVTNFGNGNATADVEIRNGAELINLVDGAIHLPDGETVTGASLDISTSMATHSAQSRIDVETMPKVWNPAENNQLTAFSNIDNFQYQIENTATPVSLKSEGFLTDFEGSPDGFTPDPNFPMPMSNTMWEHGPLSVTNIPPGCASVTMCWGTGLGDTNYTDDNNGAAFSLGLLSPALFVDPLLKSKSASFSSWHSFETVAGSSSNAKRYPDCGYLQVRTSPDGSFPPDASGFQFLPIDFANSSGIGYGSGYSQGGGNTGTDARIHSACVSNSQDQALSGTSVNPTNNPTGWANLVIDLNEFTDSYVQIRFVMRHIAYQSATYPSISSNESGWYIDNFRLGDLMPQNESMIVRNMLPSSLGGDNHPNGYGLLTIEAETSSTAVLSVDVLDTTNQIIDDRHGEPLAGLTGDIIELWDIDSEEHRSVNLRFNFNSGPARLSTPVLHGFSLGTRVGTGFNDTAALDMTEGVVDGLWSTLGGGMPMIYRPQVQQLGFSPVIERTKFSYPVTAITPMIQDDCSEIPSLSITPLTGVDDLNLTVGSKTVLSNPIFGFTSVLSYEDPCDVGGMWFDLEFGHHAEQVQIDVANDGDVDYGFNEPAFDMFGRQTKFILNTVDGVNYGTDDATLTLNVNGQAQGAFFMLPEGATVRTADVSFDQISVRSNTDPLEGYSLSLMAGSQSVVLGDMPNSTVLTQEMLASRLPLKDALNNLLTNPSVSGTHQDEFGRYWVMFRFAVDSPNASSGTSMKAVHLDVVYDYTTTLDESDGLDLELNQGVALWTGGATAEVPVSVSANSGGSVLLENLMVSTATGYGNTLTMTDNPVGLYPNGEIYEVVTTHTVTAPASSLSEAWLTFESPNDYIKLSWSEFLGFAEAEDPNDYLALEATSSAVDVANGKQITWQFRVNPTWDDTETVRIYAGLTSNSGVNGLPDAVLLDPATGNAVENDAGIVMFELQNSIGVQQPLTGAESGQDINIIGQIRLEDLAESPDPSAYYMVLELRHMNITDGNVTVEWEEVANRSGVIGGDFNWNIDLGSAAGSETYRFAVRGYDDGDLVCPPAVYMPDATCAIPFDISIDTYEPNLLDLQVLSPGTDRNVDENWRTLLDDTWVVPQSVQEIRMSSQDLPNPPSSLDLHYWVEHDHDANADGIPDADEYATITMASDGEAPTANYTGTYSDYANEGLRGKVSIWVEGYDNAGNPIDGGAPGFENDRVSYVSMTSRSPVIRNFNIEDSRGNTFLNANEQQWDGTWNQTMYAGNVYHLLTEASDDNGWRDIDFFKLNLDKTSEDMVVWYFPRNETAWTDSPYLSIVDTEEVGPSMLNIDGTALIDPFEGDFIVDIPIQINWGIAGLNGQDIEPRLQMQDLDNPLYTMLSGIPGRHIQIWRYSDGIQLDFRTDPTNNLMVTPMFEDASEPFTQDVRQGFVYAGDTIRFQGQYAFREGIYDSVYINPEVELSMEITRAAAAADPLRGYTQYPGETVVMNFTGGVFDFNLTAPIFTNEYSYTFQLVNLPDGAEDFTASICATTTDYGCGAFTIKVDLSPPTVKANTWSTQKGALPESAGEDRFNVGTLSTANFHCVDVNVQITEREAMFPGDLSVNWMFYQDNTATPAVKWNEYVRYFGAEPGTATLDLSTIGDGYAASATCLDLWPITEGVYGPDVGQMNGIELVFWVSGVDSAGSAVVGGGGPQEDGSVIGISSDEAKRRSLYTFINEEATFEIVDVLLDDDPRVGDKMKLRVKVRNTGTMAGVAELEVKSVIDQGTPRLEIVVPTQELGVAEQSDWIEIELEPFTAQTTGMYYTISLNGTSEVLYDGSSAQWADAFNVKVAEEEDSGSFLLIVVLLVGVIGVLGTVVVVLARRGSGDGPSMFEEEYEDDDDLAAPSKTLAAIPSNVSPQMAEAMEAFPDWTQDQIQGYFDQGWDIASLQDWRNNQ